MTEPTIIINGLSDLQKQMQLDLIRRSYPTSGYEKAVLLECRIGRVAAWTQFIGMIGLGIAKVARPNILPGRTLAVQALLFLGATLSARCEYVAEKELADIWNSGLNVETLKEMLDKAIAETEATE